jgi:hypothetical protein
VRAFAISRNQRFELELQWVPKEIDVMRDPTAGRRARLLRLLRRQELIEEAHKLTRSRSTSRGASRASPPASLVAAAQRLSGVSQARLASLRYALADQRTGVLRELEEGAGGEADREDDGRARHEHERAPRVDGAPFPRLGILGGRVQADATRRYAYAATHRRDACR